MEHDEVFRWVLIIACVIFVHIAATFRIRAHATGEKIDRRQEGWFILLTLRPVAALHFGGLFAFMIHPPWMEWAHMPVPTWLGWCGVALGIGSAAWFIWTFRHLGKNLTDTVVTRQSAYLVISGPYAWVRHPLYVGFMGAFAANSLVAANWFLALTGVLTLLLVYLRTEIEEQKLIDRFGEDYTDYMQNTGRFLPKIGNSEDN